MRMTTTNNTDCFFATDSSSFSFVPSPQSFYHMLCFLRGYLRGPRSYFIMALPPFLGYILKMDFDFFIIIIMEDFMPKKIREHKEDEILIARIISV